MGGLKLSPEHRNDLTPSLVLEAAVLYREFLKGFNDSLLRKGIPPLVPIAPTGSSGHAEKDVLDNPEARYGDIDFLVSFPVTYASSDEGSRRRDEFQAARDYIELLAEYMMLTAPPMVDVNLTLSSSPLMVIVRLPSGRLVQVDTIVTHPDYVKWMKGRYATERGIKGYVTGNLYKALGDYLVLTIGTEGVMARTKDGQRVPSKFRSGITYHSVSTDFRNFFRDIADYVIEGAYAPDLLLEERPGLDPDNVNVPDLAYGILGLARTLERAGDVDAKEMLLTIHRSFVDGMEKNVGKKVSKDITPEQEAKMRKLNVTQGERVRQIFGA